MITFNHIIQLLIVLLIACIFGYVFTVMKEYSDLLNRRVVINSKAVSQDILDGLDLQIFKVGNTKLKTGDIVKIYSSIKKSIKGTVLGAQIKDNSLVLLMKDDEIISYKISDIKRLRVVSRYGRLF